MPIPLYAPDGQPVDLPIDAAHKAIVEGTAGPLKDQPVPVRLKDGRRWDIEGHELAEALANGATLVDPEVEKHEAALKAQEGLGGAWDAANTGLLTGATAGLGPGLIRKGISAISPEAGKRFAEHIETQREAHPYVSLGSEVVGAAGAALVSKGASGEATAARLLPAAGIDAIGAAAEHGIAKIGGRAAAQAAARASTEGALFAAGTHVGEDILGDHETAADKLLVATAKGGALGLGLGTVLGGAGSLIRSARGAARKGGGALLSEAATEATTAAEQKLAAAEAEHAEISSRGVPPPKEPLQGLEGLSPSARSEITLRNAEDPILTARRTAWEAEAEASQKNLAAATQEAKEAADLHKLSAEVQAGDPHSLIDRLAWQSTGADAGITKRINKFPGGTDRAGATMRRLGILDVAEGEGAVKATLGSFSENTPEKMLERTETKLSELVERMQGIGGTKTHATLGELLAPLDAQIAKLGEVSTTVPVARQLAAQRQMLLGTPKFQALLNVDGNLIKGAEESPVSLSDIIAERRGVGRKAYAVGDVHANIMKESNAALYKAWDELEQKALDAAEKGLGGQFKSLKTDITDLINVEKALEGKIARASSARAFGVLPHMAGMAGGAVGGAILPGIGHLAGHGIAAMLSKSVMDRGNAAAAVALTKIADIGAVRHLMGVVDSKVSRAAKGLTSTAEVKATKVRIVGGSASGADRDSRTPPIAQRYRDAIEKLDAMEAQTSPVHERAMQATQDLAQHAPNVASFFATGMARAAAFLSSKRPQPLMPADPYSLRAPSILDTDKLAFVKSFDAGTNLMGVLDRFEKGVVSSQDVEALQAVAPKVYEALHEKVMAEIATRHAAGKTMPFKRRMELAMLFPDAKIEPSLDPPTYRMLQKNVFTEPPPDQPPSKGGKSNAPRRPTSGKMSSPMDAFWSKSGPGRK